VVARKKVWSECDFDRLKALVASGASALRASVALKRSVSVTKQKARDLGIPFRPEAELREQRRRIFRNSTDRPHVGARFPINDDGV
jgi:hypothetical protein